MPSKERLKAAHQRERGQVKGIMVYKELNKRVISGKVDSSSEQQKKAEQDSVLRSGNKAHLDLETY